MDILAHVLGGGGRLGSGRTTSVVGRVVVVGLAVGTTALTVLTVVFYAGGMPPSLTWSLDPAVVLASALSGLLLVAACWWSLGSQPWVSVGLAVCCLAVLVPSWAWYPGLTFPARAVALAATPLLVVGAAVTTAAWPGRPASRGALMVAVVAGLVASVVQVLAYDPERHLACGATCGPAPAPLADSLGPREAFVAVTILVATAVTSCVVGCVTTRSAPTLLRGGAAASALLVGVTYASVALSWHAFPRPGWWDAVLVGSGVVLAVAAAASVARAAVTRGRLRVLADQLDSPLRALTVAVGVRGIELRVPGTDVWVDPHGRPVVPSNGGLLLADGSGSWARLELQERRSAAVAAAALSPSIRLALMNVRLDAASRFRREQVMESQRRIVGAGDAERHRIERDLHDGAQQPLVAASIQIQLAADRADAPTRARLDVVASEVRRALGALRELSHGLVPAALSDGGLAAALEELAGESPLIVDIVVADLPELDPSSELAAYQAVDAALEAIRSRPTASRASVHVTVDGGRLRIDVVDHDGTALRSADLVAVRDRVGACGGSVDVDRGGSRLVVTLPCA